MRDRTKVNWEFVCQGTFNPELMKDELDLHYAETARGEHGFQYCYINITKKRAGQLENAFMEYDRMVPDSMRIKLTNLPTEPAMIGFGRGNAYKKHVIYKEIKAQQQKGCSSYNEWRANTAGAQDDEMAMEDSGDELELQANKRQANPQSIPAVRAKKHQGEPASNQQTLDSFIKRTDETLVNIHNDNYERDKSLSKCLSEINDNVDGLKNASVGSDAKLDGVTQLVIDSHTKIDSMNKTVADFVEQQDDLSALINGRDHYEKMYYKVRGILAANATRENKPIHAELAESKAREATMTLQLADLNQIGTDIMSIDERDKRVEQDIAKLKAGQAKLEAGQVEIKQMLVSLLSKA